jgi:protein-tyrosine phosphatase
MESPPTRLLFVCLGNICRSPTGEGVMRHLVTEAGLTERILIDSAGTGSWHIGHPPDERSVAAAAARGITIEGTARQVTSNDFEEFDLLLAADLTNLRDLHAIAPTQELADKALMLRCFDPMSTPDDLEVPDPYYGGANGFDDVIDLVGAACEGLLEEIIDGRV